MLSIYVQCLMKANQEPGKTSSSNPDSSLKTRERWFLGLFPCPNRKLAHRSGVLAMCVFSCRGLASMRGKGCIIVYCPVEKLTTCKSPASRYSSFDQADIEKTPPFHKKRWSFMRCGRLPFYPMGK